MIIILTVYSLIGTILAFTTNDDIVCYYAVGFIGWVLILFSWIYRRIKHWSKYHDKRSIFKKEETGQQYWCELKDTNDIYNWCEGYELGKRYAPKSEWEVLEPFSKEFIDKSKRNCDNCKYDKDCTFDGFVKSRDKIKCKHDEFGEITEFDKFDKK